MTDIKVGLYTITYSGLYYRGPHVPIEELIPKIKSYGYDGIEIESKRPFGFPPDWNKEKRKEVVELASSYEIEIAAIAGYTNFQSPIMEETENELMRLWEEIRLASDLGAPIVRVFAAWKGVTLKDGLATYDFSRHTWKYPTTQLETWQRCRDCLKEGAKWAEDYGVTLALQTHGPLLRVPGYEDTLRMIKEVGSDNLKMCLDPAGWWGYQPECSTEYIRKAVEDCRDYIVHSHFGDNFMEKPDGEIVQAEQTCWAGYEKCFEMPFYDYKTFIHELKKIGYKGYLSYEVCSPVVTNPKGSDNIVKGIEEVDRRVKLAVKFMKKVISEA